MPAWFTVLGLCFTGFLVYVFFVETVWIKYERLVIPVAKPLQTGRVRILHLSDLHFKKWDPRKLRIFAALGKKEFDLIVLTGDMIDDFYGNASALSAFEHLRSRYGIYCVFGNHEYLYYSVQTMLHFFRLHNLPARKNPHLKEFSDGLKKIGIVHLGNRLCVLKELGITLVGVDDFRAGMSRMEKATAELPRDTFNILLAHHPDSLLAAKSEWFDLALCGHTHGGQIRLPFIGALFTDSILPKHLAMGNVQINGINTYISRGLSTSRHTIPRLLCRPEITQIELVGQG